MNVFLIYTLCLLFEFYFFKSESLNEYLQELYFYYKKNIFLFFIINPCFFMILYLVLYSANKNMFLYILFFIHLSDIIIKISLFDAILHKKNNALKEILKEDFKIKLGFKISSFVIYMVLFLLYWFDKNLSLL